MNTLGFFEIQNLSDVTDLPNQLLRACILKFTYFNVIMYLSG